MGPRTAQPEGPCCPRGAACQSAREQVLAYEDARKLVEAASFAAQIPCSCRETMRNCNCPVDVCLVLGEGVLGGHIDGTPVRDERYAVKPHIRPVSIDEAVHILNRAEEAGLVHSTMNIEQDSWFMCNCCSHACFLLRGITELDIPHAVAPSSFWSVIDEGECNGCGACEEACHLSAISLVDGVAKVDYERCLGCGVCVRSCATEAIRLEKRGSGVRALRRFQRPSGRARCGAPRPRSLNALFPAGSRIWSPGTWSSTRAASSGRRTGRR